MTLFKRSTTRAQKVAMSKDVCKCSCGHVEIIIDGEIPSLVCEKCGGEMVVITHSEKSSRGKVKK
jgi:hypothetical protein